MDSGFGSLLEGETLVIIAGFLTHLGYLQLKFVILFSFLDSLLGDQIYFYLGRKKKAQFLGKKPDFKRKADEI